MEEKMTPLQRFFTACDDLMNSKHILADKKIEEVMRSIAVCDELTGLFSAVTKGFDYQAAKRVYLRLPDKTRTRAEVYLPTDETELLAFVFCLLAEIDSGAFRLNDFLLRYFYVDGSHTASYALFLERVIRPFRNILRRCFPDTGRAPLYRPREDEVFAVLAMKVAAEQARLRQLSLRDEDAVAGESILGELSVATHEKDVSNTKALLCGYLYFLQVVEGSPQNGYELFTLASEL